MAHHPPLAWGVEDWSLISKLNGSHALRDWENRWPWLPETSGYNDKPITCNENDCAKTPDFDLPTQRHRWISDEELPFLIMAMII